MLALVLSLSFNLCTSFLKSVFLSTISAFGVDAAFSYKYNQQLGVCGKDGLALCPGFTTTHVIPVWFPVFLFTYSINGYLT